MLNQIQDVRRNTLEGGFIEHEAISNDTQVVLNEVSVQSEVEADSEKSLTSVLTSVPDLDTDSFTGNTHDDKFHQLAKVYGNNIFALQVENTTVLGVLKEIPALSLTSKWEHNAVTDILDKFAQLPTTNTKLQIINSIFGVPQTPFVAGGAATTQVYTGCTETSFNLQFRIYSTESIGPVSNLTGYKRALAALCIYAPPLHTFDPNTMLSLSLVNLGKSAITLLSAMNGTVEYLNQSMSPDAPNTPEAEKIKNAKNPLEHFGEAGSAVLETVRADDKTTTREQLDKAIKEFRLFLDDAETFLQDPSRVLPDKTRVESPLNYYTGMFGGAIWNLSILPGILNHKIPVYVKSWTVKPSKEIDCKGQAAYMDFTVNCIMDQTKTGSWWDSIIYSAEGDAYKNLYKATSKTAD